MKIDFPTTQFACLWLHAQSPEDAEARTRELLLGYEEWGGENGENGGIPIAYDSAEESDAALLDLRTIMERGGDAKSWYSTARTFKVAITIEVETCPSRS